MLSTLHRYVFRELAKGFVMSFLALTGIMFLGAAFKSLRHGIGALEILRFAPYVIPFSFAWVVPAAILTTTVMTYGRLSADNELAAIRASGIPIRYMCYPALVMALGFTVLAIPLNDYVIPYCRMRKSQELRRVIMEEPFKFKAAGGDETIELGDYRIFVQRVEGKTLHNVVVIAPKKEHDDTVPRPHRPPKPKAAASPGTKSPAATKPPPRPSHDVYVYRAESAVYSVNPAEQAIRVELQNAEYTIVAPNRSARSWLKMSAGVHVIRIKTDADARSRFARKRTNSSTPDLHLRLIAHRHELAAATTPKQRRVTQNRITHVCTEIRRRDGLAFASLALCLVGMPLGIWIRRESKLASFAAAVFVYLLHYALLIGGEGLAIEGKVAPWLGLWMPDILTGAFGFGMLLHTFRR